MQAFGLVILNHLDVIEREESTRDALKRSMVANGNFDHRSLFPDYFRTDPAVEDADADFGNSDLDYSEVEWKSPSEDPEGFEKMMALLAASSSGVKSGDQVAEKPGIAWSDWR